MGMDGKSISEYCWHIAVILFMKVRFSRVIAVWMDGFPISLERHVDVAFVEI